MSLEIFFHVAQLEDCVFLQRLSSSVKQRDQVLLFMLPEVVEFTLQGQRLANSVHQTD